MQFGRLLFSASHDPCVRLVKVSSATRHHRWNVSPFPQSWCHSRHPDRRAPHRRIDSLTLSRLAVVALRSLARHAFPPSPRPVPPRRARAGRFRAGTRCRRGARRLAARERGPRRAARCAAVAFVLLTGWFFLLAMMVMMMLNHTRDIELVRPGIARSHVCAPPHAHINSQGSRPSLCGVHNVEVLLEIGMRLCHETIPETNTRVKRP